MVLNNKYGYELTIEDVRQSLTYAGFYAGKLEIINHYIWSDLKSRYLPDYWMEFSFHHINDNVLGTKISDKLPDVASSMLLCNYGTDEFTLLIIFWFQNDFFNIPEFVINSINELDWDALSMKFEL